MYNFINRMFLPLVFLLVSTTEEEHQWEQSLTAEKPSATSLPSNSKDKKIKMILMYLYVIHRSDHNAQWVNGKNMVTWIQYSILNQSCFFFSPSWITHLLLASLPKRTINIIMFGNKDSCCLFCKIHQNERTKITGRSIDFLHKGHNALRLGMTHGSKNQRRMRDHYSLQHLQNIMDVDI